MVIVVILAIITNIIAGWYAFNAIESESVKKIIRHWSRQ